MAPRRPPPDAAALVHSALEEWLDGLRRRRVPEAAIEEALRRAVRGSAMISAATVKLGGERYR